jgi:excinuclease ABC subunit C
VIKRRYFRLLEEDSQLPDLILIDGGKGQLNAALESLQSLSLKIPCVSLAKENEEIFVPHQKNSIVISKNNSSLKILQHARDETHRFGVAYNRTIRKNQIK